MKKNFVLLLAILIGSFAMAEKLKTRKDIEQAMPFPVGNPNTGFTQYFIGTSYFAPVTTSQVGIFNVTFEPGCRNNWHTHTAKSGGGKLDYNALKPVLFEFPTYQYLHTGDVIGHCTDFGKSYKNKLEEK